MSTKTVESATEETVTLYRNFGPNELKSIPKPPNAEIIIPKSYTTPNHPNYIFRESGFDIIDGLPHFDGHPGGSVLPEKLDLFNKVIKVNWIK
ncbi:MAG: hypothetical protein EOO20_12660 [Chryseobacterium sp.]|nr:MAG: hypothetical protein EOO20_12660 [Chryseobacterium sp.]